MLGVTDLTTYVIGTIGIVLLPGPNSMYVLATAAQRGVRAGYRAASGVFLGDTILMFLAAAGVASLLRAFPPVFTVLKWAGAVYLAYLGGKMLIDAVKAWRNRHAPPSTEPVADEAAVAEKNPFKRAFLVSLVNPKAILFLISFFTQFVDPAYAHPAVTFLLLGAIVQVFSFTYLSTLIFTGTRLSSAFRRRRRLAAAGTTAIGALFIGFGLKLATSSM